MIILLNLYALLGLISQAMYTGFILFVFICNKKKGVYLILSNI